MKLEGVSAFELWNHQGPLETTTCSSPISENRQ